MNVSLGDEIEAIVMLCNQMWSMNPEETYTTNGRHYGAANSLFISALKDDDCTREQRLEVIGKFIGRKIASTSQLTKHEAHVLIEQLKSSNKDEWGGLSEHGYDLIRYAFHSIGRHESDVEEFKPLELQTLTKVEPDELEGVREWEVFMRSL